MESNFLTENDINGTMIKRKLEKGSGIMKKIKICGLRREEDIAYANECRPDFVGFVFADSKRKVTKSQAKHLKALLHSDIVAVGVFVNEEVTKVAELVKEGIIQMVQLHGEEDNEYIERLRKLVGEIEIIKAVRVASKEDIRKCQKTAADYLLFDSYSIEAYGGTGKTFDWSLIKEIDRPFFLAGGIQAGNLQEAIALDNVYALDVSSAVETDGCKDRKKMLEIVNTIRNLSKISDKRVIKKKQDILCEHSMERSTT